MVFKSDITGRTIDFNDNVRILNPKQAAFYWGEKHISPVRVYPSKDWSTNESVIVFVFQKSATQEAYQEWMERR